MYHKRTSSLQATYHMYTLLKRSCICSLEVAKLLFFYSALHIFSCNNVVIVDCLFLITKSNSFQLNMINTQEELQQVLFQRRVLTFVTGCTGLGFIAWIVALATDFWLIAVPKVNANETAQIGDIQFLWSHSGLWRKCDFFNASNNEQVINEKNTSI